MPKAEASLRRNKRTARKPSSSGDLNKFVSSSLSIKGNINYRKIRHSPLGCSATSAFVAAATAGERPCERQLVLDASEEVDGVREWDGLVRRCLGGGEGGVWTGAGRRSIACGSEWRHDAAAERELPPLWRCGANEANGLRWVCDAAEPRCW